MSFAFIGFWAFAAKEYRETAWDFTMFYVAAHAPIDSIHDQAAFQSTAKHLLSGTGVQYASPYVRPAVFALPLRWMRCFSYWRAYWIWAALQFAFYIGSLWLLATRLSTPVLGFYPWLLFFPAFFGIITGQDSLAMGFLLCAVLALLRDRRDGLAGALLSLSLYKFNLFLLLPVYLLLRRRYRALVYYAGFGVSILAASAFLEAPSKYLTLLPQIERYTIGFSPKTMLGLRSVCANMGCSSIYPVAALGLAAWALFYSRRMEFDWGFGMVVLASILSAYHAAWYDGAILILPFGLALARGDHLLRAVTVLLLIVPFWNIMPVIVTYILLVFVGLFYSTKQAISGPTETLMPLDWPLGSPLDTEPDWRQVREDKLGGVVRANREPHSRGHA